MVASDPTDLDRLLDGLVTGLDRARHAVALSTDGMLLGRSGQLGPDDAGHLSAVASAFRSLADGAGVQFGGGAVRQTVVELDRATLFVAAAG
ncbi:roadblock/LC7 domain-containing protein, partial [Saccharomonospora halophila]|uniref:roadblock/LC7 domain-containing protein n=1 Tax=Saccharomonospora halophila TaxID=129922 RepID=UPI00048D0C83